MIFQKKFLLEINVNSSFYLWKITKISQFWTSRHDQRVFGGVRRQKIIPMTIEYGQYTGGIVFFNRVDDVDNVDGGKCGNF